ncbi:MAG: ACP phosphodiesterase [Ferruginibacter sp.]
MISDFIKGKKQFDYPVEIQKGIRLHRAIDDFTDHHPATKKINKFFHARYRLYSGAFTDIVYDYFLANDVNEFKNETVLLQFAASTYQQLQQYHEYFPEKFARLFPYMQQQDWLSNYRFPLLIEKSFGGLVYRAAYLKESTHAFNTFMNHQTEMKEQYNEFFPDVKQFAIDQLEHFLKQ